MDQVLANGIVLGSLFAGVAVGLTLIYGVMEVPNFAHSGIIALSAFATWSASQHEIPFVLAAAIGVVVGGVLSAATEFLAYRWVRDNPLAAPAIALGLLLILENTALRLYGGEGKALNTPYDEKILHVGGISLSGVKVALVIITVVSLAVLSLLLSRTSMGRAIRAVAQDREAAGMLGIPMQRQYMLAFVVAGLLGGLSAVAFAPTYQVSPFMADEVLLSAFVVIVLGGLGSVWGAVVGGLALGIVESLGSAYISSSYQSAFGFIALVVVLVWRPAGLLSAGGRRVA